MATISMRSGPKFNAPISLNKLLRKYAGMSLSVAHEAVSTIISGGEVNVEVEDVFVNDIVKECSELSIICCLSDP